MITIEQMKEIIIKLNFESYMDEYTCGRIFNNSQEIKQKFIFDSGCTKGVLIPVDDTPYVVKWSLGTYNNEAQREAELYEKAKQLQIERFFPCTEILFTHNEVVYVLQEKVDTNFSLRQKQKYSLITKTATERMVNKVQEDLNKVPHHARQVNSTWIKMALVLYGKKRVKTFCKFVVENGINDLHGGNIGYIKNKPVVLDFSGYYR